jgi:orotate phosphoribosyltransferase-like protein
MYESGQAYQTLIQRLADVLPDVAAQIREEVARGRVVAGTSLSASELQARESRMYEAKVGGILKADVASVEYTDDERLALLVDSVIRTAATMRSSLEAVSQPSGSIVASVTFEEPDGTDRVEIGLSEELTTRSQVSVVVSGLLSTALTELGGTP